ncbi:hypothetical protein NDU88_001499 [Pleurodeles waltl]|uniref:Uncharacterized protein n=1 Tax=Pleurodeles waltl TaxID=8319 RepID=A0AAV7SZH4_PLEWA|nr:hypothetical protein NDU88_001499 [Pleurodeles waltl]
MKRRACAEAVSDACFRAVTGISNPLRWASVEQDQGRRSLSICGFRGRSPLSIALDAHDLGADSENFLFPIGSSPLQRKSNPVGLVDRLMGLQ